MPRLHFLHYPHFNQTLQEALLIHFHIIEFEWLGLPPEKEGLAPTRMKQLHWAIIRDFLFEIVDLMKTMPSMDDVWEELLPRPVDCIEMVFRKLVNLWRNHLKVGEQEIPNDDPDWSKLNHLLRELRVQLQDICHSRFICLHEELGY